jgi:hypothetical protein
MSTVNAVDKPGSARLVTSISKIVGPTLLSWAQKQNSCRDDFHHPQMLDMWVIFVNISPVIGPVIHEERKAPACRQSLHV